MKTCIAAAPLLILWVLFALGDTGAALGKTQTPNPAKTDWPTEEISAKVQDELKRIIKNSLAGTPLPLGVAANATCTTLEATNLEVVRDDSDAQIYRLADGLDSQTLIRAKLPAGLSELLQPLRSTNEPNTAPQVQLRVKISRIRLSGNEVAAQALLFANGRTDAGAIQINTTLDTQWQLVDNAPTLQSISIAEYERAQLTSQQKWFQDATTALFAGDPAFTNQLTAGLGDWLNRIERFAGSSIYTRHGHALADVNGDGLTDLYLCQPGGLPNRLFLQGPDGRLTDHSAKSQVDWLNDTRSAVFVDLDNDGDQDLVLGTFVGAYVCENTGHGVFTKANKLPEIERDISSITAVDYDNDGDLDIHVCVYFSDATLAGKDPSSANVYDSRATGGTNVLYRNLLEKRTKPSGTLQFENVTKEVGLVEGNHRFSLAASWEDFDNDGDQDLYVANDFGINCLHRNEGGRFVNASKQLGVEDYGPGMSVGWGDFNRDGKPDLYISNMFSAAGNRVTRQEQFTSTAHGTSRKSFQRFNKGNSLYQFNGKQFEEVPGAAGAQNALWAWSSLLVDIDNDGWQDALVANGYITGPGGGDL